MRRKGTLTGGRGSNPPSLSRKTEAIRHHTVRIGQNGKRFKMNKVRSLYWDAEERKKGPMAQKRVKSGMMFKLALDP